MKHKRLKKHYTGLPSSGAGILTYKSFLSLRHTVDYYLALIKKEIWPFATTWMDLEGIKLSEISQAEIDKYGTYMWKYSTYMWNLNTKQTNK